MKYFSKAVFLTRSVLPYRVAFFEVLSCYSEKLSVFVSRATEANCQWNQQAHQFEAEKIPSATLVVARREQDQFADKTCIHLPLSLLFTLFWEKPDVLYSSEFQLRTVFAALYLRARGARICFVVIVDLSEHTEAGRGRLRLWLATVAVNGRARERYLTRLGVSANKLHLASCATDAKFSVPPCQRDLKQSVL